MATSSTSNAVPARSSRSTVQDETKAPPVDERVLKELQAYRPYQALEDMILAIIHQTYAALIEFLGLGAPPEGGGPVKATQVVDAPPPHSTSFSPMLLVVEASSMHCCVHLAEIDNALEAAGDGGGDDGSGKECRHSVALRKNGPRGNRRAKAASSQGMVHLARNVSSDDDDGWRNRAGDVRPDVSGEKGLVGVLDAMSSRMGALMREGDRVVAAVKAAGAGRLIPTHEIRRVGMILATMRRQVDLDQVMRVRLQCRLRGMTNVNVLVRRPRRRRRPEDVAADVVAKRRQQTADVMAERFKGLKV
ncbi:unnamed protein product [Urochloa humidicola]